MTWIKTRFPEPRAALFEADGLRWLAQAPGGARIAEVISVRPGRLELEEISSARPTPAAARIFGAALARTHAAGAEHMGYIPGDTPGYMGQAPLPPAPSAVEATGWGEFYAAHRVQPFLRTAVQQGRIDRSGQAVIESVITRLTRGELDHDQPAAVDGVARLHGDLWTGNVLWETADDGEGAAREGGSGGGGAGGAAAHGGDPGSGGPDGGGAQRVDVRAVLIDPTAHGGHAETDLAMLELFGQPYLSEILEGYQEVSPLAAGWQDRVSLHQLNPLLVHTVLFGGSYAAAAVAAARPYA